MRLPIVGVMGSGVEPHRELAEPLGRLIAESGCHLLTGGGAGVMESVAEGFCRVEGRRGLSLGIIRALEVEPWTPGPVNSWVEVPIYTHLCQSGENGQSRLSRNHINVLSSDLLIALPGGPGTRSEVELRLGYGRPVLLHLSDLTIDGDTVDAILAAHAANPLICAARSLEDCRRELQVLRRGWMAPDDPGPIVTEQ